MKMEFGCFVNIYLSGKIFWFNDHGNIKDGSANISTIPAVGKSQHRHTAATMDCDFPSNGCWPAPQTARASACRTKHKEPGVGAADDGNCGPKTMCPSTDCDIDVRVISNGGLKKKDKTRRCKASTPDELKYPLAKRNRRRLWRCLGWAKRVCVRGCVRGFSNNRSFC